MTSGKSQINKLKQTSLENISLSIPDNFDGASALAHDSLYSWRGLDVLSTKPGDSGQEMHESERTVNGFVDPHEGSKDALFPPRVASRPGGLCGDPETLDRDVAISGRPQLAAWGRQKVLGVKWITWKPCVVEDAVAIL